MRFVAFCVAVFATAILSRAGEDVSARPAVVVLTGGGQPDTLAEARKSLADPKPLVRLAAALALIERQDEQAVGVLIDLLFELPPEERRQAEQALQQLAGEWAPSPPLPGEDELSRKIRREAWAGWWKVMDGTAILAAFGQRTLTKEQLIAAELLIAQLGDKSVSKRDQAEAELVAQGIKVVVLLRDAAKNPDQDISRRAESCLKQIVQNDTKAKLPLSAPLLLAIRKPAGAAEALLGYLGFTEDRSMKEEVTKALKSLVQSADKADVAAIAALSDSLPVRRIAAAEALAGAGGGKHFPAVRKLLNDPDSAVRLRAAVALVHGQDKQSVPALISLLGDMARGDIWEVEELLHRLAGEKAPVVAWGKDNAEARSKLRDAWQEWWMKQGAGVNLAELEKLPGGSGLTLVAEVGPRIGVIKKGAAVVGGKDRVAAIDRNGQLRWQIQDLDQPIDVQLLSGNRVLIAEYYAQRVTERDPNGKILWEIANLPGSPVNVQRLANGNTFIALYNTVATGGLVMEVDRAGNTVSKFSVGRAGPIAGPIAAGPGGAFGVLNGLLLAAHKMADGRIVCLLTDETILWVDATGKEIKQFRAAGAYVGALMACVGAIDVTAKGHIVVMQNNNSVVEYDPDGKLVWQAKASGNRVNRLVNGNTLVAFQSGGVVELDNTGRVVWHYEPPAGLQAIRARR